VSRKNQPLTAMHADERASLFPHFQLPRANFLAAILSTQRVKVVLLSLWEIISTASNLSWDYLLTIGHQWSA
jgi:hypothetical protein